MEFKPRIAHMPSHTHKNDIKTRHCIYK